MLRRVWTTTLRRLANCSTTLSDNMSGSPLSDTRVAFPTSIHNRTLRPNCRYAQRPHMQSCICWCYSRCILWEAGRLVLPRSCPGNYRHHMRQSQQAEHVQEVPWLPMRRTPQLEGTDSGPGPQPGCRLPCVLRSDACGLLRRLASFAQHSPGSCAACFPWLCWLLAPANSTDPSVAAPAGIAHRSCCR